MAVEMVVVGHAVPKGTLVRGRGRAMYYPRPLKEWEAVVRERAVAAMRGLPLIGARCNVGARFYLAPTKGGKAPGRLRGDLDKLVRAVLDAMTGVVYEDDELVCGLLASKLPVEPDGLERVELSINIAPL